MLFLWYDEESNRFVELYTVIDKELGTASTETTHFSKYMIVDRQEWYEAWSKEFNYNPSTDSENYEQGGYYPTIKYNTVLAIDCSGSMDWNDPDSQRVSAAEKFLEYMHQDDKGALVLFTDTASLEVKMTSEEAELKSALKDIYSSGGTSLSSAINEAVSAFEPQDINAMYVNNRIILLSDGDDGGSKSAREAAIQSCIDQNISIYTVGFGEANDSIMQEIADSTRGEYFKAVTSEELVDIFAKIGYSSDFDMTDSDFDGLPDIVEIMGIRTQFGEIITDCDPQKPDSDGDGLLDGEEIDPTPRVSYVKKYLPNSAYFTIIENYYFEMYSDPTPDDSISLDSYSNIDSESVQEIIESLDEYLNEIMPPKYDYNGVEITSKNKICDATWDYFHEKIWPVLLEEGKAVLGQEFAAYTNWVRQAYGTYGLETLWLTMDRYVDLLYYELLNPQTLDKIKNQVIKGNYSDDVTITGTASQIAISFWGIDFVADVRDVTYDISHWKWTWSHAGQTGLDMIGLLPIVGAVKNFDEFAALSKLSKVDALNDSVDTIDDMLKAGKNGSEIVEAQRKYASEIIASLKYKISNQITDYLDTLPQDKINHIINGSQNLNHVHNWEKLVPNKNWTDIKTYIINTMIEGTETINGNAYMKSMFVNGYRVEVTYAKVSGVYKISDAWIRI